MKVGLLRESESSPEDEPPVCERMVLVVGHAADRPYAPEDRMRSSTRTVQKLRRPDGAMQYQHSTAYFKDRQGVRSLIRLRFNFGQDAHHLQTGRERETIWELATAHQV
jgi:hypothetical protein